MVFSTVGEIVFETEMLKDNKITNIPLLESRLGCPFVFLSKNWR